jgi:hypothetical protein
LRAKAKARSAADVAGDAASPMAATLHLVVEVRATAEREARDRIARRPVQKHWTRARRAIRYESLSRTTLPHAKTSPT